LKPETPKAVIFTDIDGTVLNEEKSFQETKPLIEQLLGLGAVVVFCSSKTRAEIEFYRKELGVTDPFIVENGGAILIPKGYFPFSFPCSKKTRKYFVVELGMAHSVVREKLAKASTATGAVIICFGDMSTDDVAHETGLSLLLARLAKQREYDEPFRLVHGNVKQLAEALEAEGLTFVAGGKYFHVLGNSDKGKAVAVLKELFNRKFACILTYGLGDSQNDLPMLAAVDKPILVRSESGGRNANLVAWREVLNLVKCRR